VSFRSLELNDIDENHSDGGIDIDNRSAVSTTRARRGHHTPQLSAELNAVKQITDAKEDGDDQSHIRKKGPASVASSNRTTSSAGFNTALTSIRKLALADWGEIEPSIRWLRRCIRITFVGIFVMAIVGYVVMQQSSNRLQSATQHIIQAGYLRDAMVLIKYNTRTLQQLAVGTLTGIEDEAVCRSDLKRAAQTMHDIHQDLYLHGSDLPDSLKAFYADDSVNVATTDGFRVTDRVTNVWNGLNMVISAANILAVTPLTSITDTSPNVFFITQNTDSLDQLYQNMVTFMKLYEADAVDVADRSIEIQASVMAVAMGLLVGIVFIVFPLVMRHVNITGHRVFLAYLDLSMGQIVQLEHSRQELLVTLGVLAEDGGKLHHRNMVLSRSAF